MRIRAAERHARERKARVSNGKFGGTSDPRRPERQIPNARNDGVVSAQRLKHSHRGTKHHVRGSADCIAEAVGRARRHAGPIVRDLVVIVGLIAVVVAVR